MPSRLHPLTLAVLVALCQPVLAAESAQKLDEVVIKGVKPTAHAEIPDVPATVESVSAEQMDEAINVINTEDALKYLPSLTVRKRFIGDTNGIVASRTAGTLASARSLVYADGLLLSNLLGNSFAYPPRWGMVTPEEVERIDVIYGPFSALYPGNSTGATVLMNTRMPEHFEAHAGTQVFAQNHQQYGTDQTFSGHQLSAAMGSRSGRFSWWIDANRLDSEGQPMSFVTKPLSTTPAAATDTVVQGFHRDLDPSGAERLVFGATSMTHTVQDNGKIKLAYDLTPTARISYVGRIWTNRAESDAETYLRDAVGAPVYSGNINVDGLRYSLSPTNFSQRRADQEHWMHGLSFKTNTGGTWDWEATASLYDYSRDLTRASGTALPAAQDGGAGTITDMDGTGWSTVDLRGIWRPVKAHEVSFGYHRDHYKLRTQVSNTSDWIGGEAETRKSAFTGDTTTQAVYLQEAWRFAPAWKATLGGRWEQWEADNGSISDATRALSHDAREESFFSPKATLSHQLTPKWLLRASVGKAYRLPTVAELFQGTISSNAIVNNDPNLKPEKVLATELTAERDLGNGLLRMTWFHEDVEDALYAQTNTTVLPTITNIQNIDRMRTNGLELAWQAVDVGLKGLDLTLSLTWADSVITRNDKNPASVGQHQPRIPEWQGKALATWRQNEKLAWSLGARYSGRQYNTMEGTDINPDTYGGTSRYFIADARVRYKLDRQWTVAAGIDNLGNEKAYAFHPYPQRTFLAELKFDY